MNYLAAAAIASIAFLTVAVILACNQAYVRRQEKLDRMEHERLLAEIKIRRLTKVARARSLRAAQRKTMDAWAHKRLLFQKLIACYEERVIAARGRQRSKSSGSGSDLLSSLTELGIVRPSEPASQGQKQLPYPVQHWRTVGCPAIHKEYDHRHQPWELLHLSTCSRLTVERRGEDLVDGYWLFEARIIDPEQFSEEDARKLDARTFESFAKTIRTTRHFEYLISTDYNTACETAKIWLIRELTGN